MSILDRPAGSAADRRQARPVCPARPAGRIFKPPDWLWAESGDVGWWVRPEWRAALLDGDGRLPLDRWRLEGRARTVKSGPHRVVDRVTLDKGVVYVKHFLVPSWREMLRQWFRRGKGRNEGKRALRLARIGVPTIEPVALGEQRRRRFLFENYLITTEIADSRPLDRALADGPDALPTAVRRRIASELGRLTARLHANGMVHDDFHPGNLLLTLDGEQPRLALIDLDALRFRRRVGPRQAAANLARLNHAARLLASRTDRLRFLRAYVATLGDERPERVRELARRVDLLTSRWAERLWRRRAKRCTAEGKEFATIRGDRRWAIASRRLDPEAARALLDEPDAPFSGPGATVLKDSRTTTVAELTLPVDGRPTRVIYKRFNYKKRLEVLWTSVRPSRAWRAWRASHHLRSRGLPTPADLLVLGVDDRTGPRRLLPGATRTYLLTRKVEPSIDLGAFVRDVLPGRPPADRRVATHRLAEALGRLVRDLHDRCLSDRDLKASNILIEGDPLADRPKLSLIDLVGVRLISPLPRHRRVQNLARLLASLGELPGWTRTDSLRVLLAYLPAHDAASGRWKALGRRVARRIERKRARNRRLGRPLS